MIAWCLQPIDITRHLPDMYFPWCCSTRPVLQPSIIHVCFNGAFSSVLSLNHKKYFSAQDWSICLLPMVMELEREILHSAQLYLMMLGNIQWLSCTGEPKRFTINVYHLPILLHTHTVTHQRWLDAVQGTNQSARWDNWGLGVLLRDTSTYPWRGSNWELSESRTTALTSWSKVCTVFSSHFMVCDLKKILIDSYSFYSIIVI